MVEVAGKKVRGRQYPWGIVDVENPEHCDFIKLRSMLITHMQDLQEVTHDVHYENFRSERLAKGGGAGATASSNGGGAAGKEVTKDEMLAQMQAQIKQQSSTNLSNLS